MVSTLDRPAALTAVRFVRDRIIGEISHRGVLAYEEPESLALFTQGRAIFHRNWPYAWAIANDPEKSQDRRQGRHDARCQDFLPAREPPRWADGNSASADSRPNLTWPGASRPL